MTMAQAVALQPVPEFHPDAEIGASLSTRWRDWLSDFEMFLVASGITDSKHKRALLLYQAGSRVREIFKQLPDTGADGDFDTAKEKLCQYFEPQKNRRYEVHRFRQATQEQSETLDKFHMRLRTLSQTCEFTDTDFEIEEQIIIRGTSSKIRKQALCDPNFKLKDMLLEGHMDEQSKFQAKDIESKDNSVAFAQAISRSSRGNFPSKQTVLKCHNCGGAYLHTGPCPAKGKQCRNCGKLNQFAGVCQGNWSAQFSGRTSKYVSKDKKTVQPLSHDMESLSDCCEILQHCDVAAILAF